MGNCSLLNKLLLITTLSLLIFIRGAISAENERYPMTCGQSWAIEPTCLSYPVSSQPAFNSCKLEVQNYLKALDYHLQCTANSFTEYINERLKKVKKHVTCVNLYMEKKRQNVSVSECPPLGRIYFMPSKIGIFLNEFWDEPNALSSPYCYNATKHSNDEAKSIMCRVGWDSFIDLDSSQYQMNTDRNAKFLHDEYLDRLINVVKKEKQLSIDCFNGWARNIYVSIDCP